ncbi:hypothetical protein L1049_024264 [Liquidambar formosana]|uniref:TF-B3 domain-containing protein n=1 Tax=Liquidambar formosana TaxID=63359 RepID=A0AAP0S190_LIQFO
MVPSTRRRQCDGGSHWSCSPAKVPHFFKIIHSAVVENRKLGIPKKFVRKYGECLSNFVYLKVPGGAIWRVELIKRDHEVWLQRGWEEFAEYYSIGFGHFLVFRYEGNSRFQVLIFDKTALEIEYPLNATQLGEEPKLEESENDVSVEILGDFPLSQKRKEMKRTNSTRKVENTFNLVLHSRSKGNLTNDGLNLPTREYNGGMPATQRRLQSGTKRPITNHKNVGALERAKAFKSENPSFVVTMQPSYVVPKFTLNMPSSFVKKYFARNHDNIILGVSDGRTWSVKRCHGANDAKLCSDNFQELIVEERAASQVTPVTRQSSCSGVPTVMQRNTRALEAARKFISKHPFFTVSITKSYLRHRNLNVPQSFVKMYIKEASQTVTLRVLNRSWPVKLFIYNNYRGNFKQSTTKERAGSKLRQVIKISSCSRVPMAMQEKARALEVANKFFSKHPFFKIVMAQSYIRKGGLVLPTRFFKRYIKLAPQCVTLRVSDRSWPVKLINHCNYSGRLSRGSVPFLRDNKLGEGDVCVFELIKRNDIVLKVSIFRCIG